MIEHLKTFGKTHLFYIILIVMGVVCFRSWLAEHDARTLAQAAVKAEQVKNADLQKQIEVVKADAAQQVKVVTKVVHDAVTPSQVVQAVPTLTDVPLNTRVIPGNFVDVEVAAVPLMHLVGELKTSQINLGACQQTSALKDEQLKIANDTITTLKKKPGFWKRVIGTAKAVGVGIGIGAVLGARL
jgi:hypothetical protein